MHKMRRAAQELSYDETADLFRRATSGVLAVIDADGAPYAVPLSFVFVENAADLARVGAPAGVGVPAGVDASTSFGALASVSASAVLGASAGENASANLGVSADAHGPFVYFHTALTGHKVDALQANSTVSFCVVGADDIIPERFTTAYRSAIAFGRAHFVEDPIEKPLSLCALGMKYHPKATEDEISAEMSSGIKRLHMVRIDIDRMTGKEGIELTRARKTPRQV